MGQRKERNQQDQHGLDFETAQLVFDDPHCVTFVERVTDGEERWHAIGSIESVIIILVVHTYEAHQTEEIIRIVSARPATLHERKLYAQAHG